MHRQAFTTGISSFILLLAGAFAAPLAVGQSTPNDYRLNPGDVISISVWKEPDLQQDVLIRPDGKFSFPLTGDIPASGRTVEEVRAQVTERLAQYIPDLVVSISVLQINGNKVYVMGQVNRPGEIVANPPIDVVQALAISGGANAFAQLNDITVVRRTPTGQISIPFRYRDIEKGKRLEQNILLKAGDIVVVP